MIEPRKVKERKIYLESKYSKPTQNLYILERGARNGYITNLEDYVNEWYKYNKDNIISLVKVLDIIKECSEKNNEYHNYNRIVSLLENGVIPKIKDIKSGIYYINDFIIENGFPCLKLLSKCNEMITYDRILNNQNVIDEHFEIRDVDDIDDIATGIYNLLKESSLPDDEKYAICLENGIYSLYLNNFIEESYDEYTYIVDMLYSKGLNESFNYDDINILHEKDGMDFFPNMIISGLIGGTYVDNDMGHNIEKKLNIKQLKQYEEKHGLTPAKDNEYAASILKKEKNSKDRDDIVSYVIVNKKIDNKDYQCIEYYDKNGEIVRVAIMYTNNKNDIVLVPIYGRLDYSTPTIISNNKNNNMDAVIESLLLNVNPLNEVSLTKEDLKKFISKLNLQKEKDVNKLKSIINTYFTRSEQSIIDGLPDIFTCIRTSIMVGSFVVNPYLGIVSFITDKFMKIKVERNNRDKILTKYDNEINKVNDKIENCKTEKKKKDLEKYLKELERNKDKLENYYRKYFTNDEEYVSKVKSKDDDFDFDFDWEDDDDMFTYDESANLVAVNEMNILNKLKLNQINLKKNMQKLSDKDRVISQRLDHAYDKFIYQIEKQMSNKNREAVIKGTLIPSLSAMIKLVTASAAMGMLINPVLGAITALGGLAASKRATQNERKYILSEIDIELKVIEKKLQLAESNNDMKAYEQLLRIQRQLESERNRIVYKKRRPVVATKYN